MLPFTTAERMLRADIPVRRRRIVTMAICRARAAPLGVCMMLFEERENVQKPAGAVSIVRRLLVVVLDALAALRESDLRKWYETPPLMVVCPHYPLGALASSLGDVQRRRW
tara:strand:- start:16626 stop:16958 length:333 start_codon:yes stop_codon:yes gene_type:complete